MLTLIKNNLPGTAKVWVYQSSRKLSEGEEGTIKKKVKDFVAQWTSHNAGVVGDGVFLYGLFLILMADESQTSVGGCSIDSSVHFIKTLEHEYRLNFFDRWKIAYRKGSDVLHCTQPEFEKLLSTGHITEDTIVFNNLVNTKAALETQWQIPYRKSWLKNLIASNTSFKSVL